MSTAPRLALSKDETLLLSSAGDVISCRCRDSGYPQSAESTYQWQEDLAYVCCDAECDDISMQAQEIALCSHWTKKGLRGGSPAQVASPLHSVGLRGGANHNLAFQSPPMSDVDTAFDEESIVPIRSFDYSHYNEGENDMLALDESKPPVAISRTMERLQQDHSSPTFIHGIPTFHSSFAQVKITQVSAHPLGSHVLLISDAALLYSYGLNDFGQLGVGVKTPVTGFHRGFVMEPTIVTPLVENGGKTLLCAAGVSHSLVVVSTQEQRLVKSNSFDSSNNSDTEAIVHHQLYGFGRNDFTKIGLMSPRRAKAGSLDEMECVTLPRRVALRCKIRERDDISQGIFCIAASEEHSAALVRRASGEVELYTWGNATYGALGLPNVNFKVDSPSAVKVVPVPSFVSSMSRTKAASSSLFEDEYPIAISLGRRCSFVVTSAGRGFSFGTSEEGMLGLGSRVQEAMQPTEIEMPSDSRTEKLVKMCAGGSHVLATTKSGRVFGWGRKCHAGLEHSQVKAGEPERSDCDSDSDAIAWAPQEIQFVTDQTSKENSTCMLLACAGYDCSIFVTDSGRVLSCGKRSGRLGHGEKDHDVRKPMPLFGSLQLWRKREQPSPSFPPMIPKARPVLKRGTTVS